MPPRASSAESDTVVPIPPPQAAEQIGRLIEDFVADYPESSILEDGKVVFGLAQAQLRISTEHGRCTLQLWSGERNLVRTVVAANMRDGSLRLSTRRFGHAQTKSLVFVAEAPAREPGRREPARQAYLRLLQRVLAREFPEWQAEGFRAAMDLERSFGPAYTRGSLVRGKEAWAVIGVGAAESQATVDGVLTLGILWLHHCRESGDGRRIYKGLRVVVPRGAAALTLARLAWTNSSAAAWELFELDERTEELLPRDLLDQGNLRTRLVHHPDERAALERFREAIEQVMALVPSGEQHRVEQRLRHPTELAFLLHGLPFARARLSLAPGSFAHVLEIVFGAGSTETLLTATTRDEIAGHVEELFRRRHPGLGQKGRTLQPHAPGRGIGAYTGRPAHQRSTNVAPPVGAGRGVARLEARERAIGAQQDPLYRAMPERWLESVLRENLAPLTRSLGPATMAGRGRAGEFANEADPDTRGNRAEPMNSSWADLRVSRASDRLIPRFDPRFVYTQVPAIAGASDRGMLDLLGMTEDGRLAVIELKAADDLQLALQGLDYWIRVRHHHASGLEATPGSTPGFNELQRHGYFRDVVLSPLPPRLYLVAPALHVHPATETILRYLSPQVEWTLLALDERWRQEIRVVWRKSGGLGERDPSRYAG